ncbi:MAG: flagellin [Synergistaceae bacterium]|jgi:flagellin|nr:flagellin [Synergistaceae bacterium]
MALIVNHNIPALQTYNAVTATTNALQKSIQKLSTGLRINSAADDAAGLAISEKMRAQIRGLDRAVANSQDGISMIQTAEGALSETHSILQRMRELSVQAANDTLTQQDRSYIQLELDQLREEVTRIGNTTQFNKKKLLDGSAAVLWSASNLETKAIINGGLRTIDQFGQKSAAEGNFKIDITAKSGTGEVQKTDIFKIKHGGESEGMTLDVNAVAADVSGVSGSNLVKGATYGLALAATATTAALSSATGIKFGTIDNGVLSGALTDTNVAGAAIAVEVLANDGTNVTYKVTAHYTTVSGQTSILDMNPITLASGTQDLGAVSGGILAGIELKFTATDDVGAKSINQAIGAGDGTASTALTLTAGATTAVGTYNIDAGKIAGKAVDFMFYNLDASGNVTSSAITVNFESDFNAAAAGAVVAGYVAKGVGGVNGIIGSVAKADTKLYDIDKFWNSEGRFLLKDPQTITITQGNGKQASITLYQNDTVQTFLDKMNNAIGNDLGQAQYLGAAATGKEFAQLAPGTGAALAVAGTIVISSVVTGDAGKLSFAGDEDVLKALSLNTLRSATESDYTVNIHDAHSGKVVAENVQVTGNKLIGLVHENVDVIFDSMIGVTAVMDTSNYFSYTYTAGDSLYLHLADNTTVFQIGANEGEDMGINIGDMRSEALGLDSVLVTDRESAARSITIIDSAIDKVSMQRARLGAYQNRLEHTITNLTVAGENLTAAESRIRDTDMAKEMMNFTKLQIMLQAGTSMLAQANALPQNVLSLLR